MEIRAYKIFEKILESFYYRVVQALVADRKKRWQNKQMVIEEK